MAERHTEPEQVVHTTCCYTVSYASGDPEGAMTGSGRVCDRYPDLVKGAAELPDTYGTEAATGYTSRTGDHADPA